MTDILNTDLKKLMANHEPRENENKMNSKVVKWLNTLPGCLAEKRPAQQGRKGRVDITGCINGIRLELEGKIGKNTPTKKQQYWLDKWASVGAITGVYRSIDDVRQILSSKGVDIIK